MQNEDKEAGSISFVKAASSMMDLMDFKKFGLLLLENDLYTLFLDA